MMRRANLLLDLAILLISPDARAGSTVADLYIANDYDQSSTGLASTTGYFAFLQAFMQSASDFNGGVVTYSGSGSPAPAYIPATLVQVPSDPLNLVPTVCPSGFSTLAALNTVFPFGAYTITATNSVTLATQSATLDYTQNYFPSVPPQLTPASYAGLQGLNAGSAFDLQFNSFAPGPAPVFSGTGINIYGPSGATVFSSSFLAPSTTDVVLPAGTLAAGSTYTCKWSLKKWSVEPPPLAFRQRHQVDLGDFPNVERWYETIMARPGVKRGFAVSLG
jgi:hypothetical protein